MTFAELKAQIPAGIVIRKIEDEYRVNLRGGTEDTAYYTDDKEDALATARAMDSLHNQRRADAHMPVDHWGEIPAALLKR